MVTDKADADESCTPCHRDPNRLVDEACEPRKKTDGRNDEDAPRNDEVQYVC